MKKIIYNETRDCPLILISIFKFFFEYGNVRRYEGFICSGWKICRLQC